MPEILVDITCAAVAISAMGRPACDATAKNVLVRMPTNITSACHASLAMAEASIRISGTGQQLREGGLYSVGQVLG